MRGLIYRLVADALGEDSGRSLSISEMRAEVSRDLENLLNTRSEAARLIPDTFKECRASSLTYGILDRIRRSLEQAISLHEGRLSRVRIALEPQRELDRALRFRIDAMLDLGDDNEKVQFDAVLQLNTQTYLVR